MRELNPGRQGEKHERYLCAMPSPQVQEDPEVGAATFRQLDSSGKKCRHRINQNQTLQSETGDWNIAGKTFRAEKGSVCKCV